jgi:NADH-quinone oxidoreductase subunit A
VEGGNHDEAVSSDLRAGRAGGRFCRLFRHIRRYRRAQRWNRAKLESYECGIEPTPMPPQGGKVPVKYYLTAMLFIVFDIEIIFLYPWAVAFNKLGAFGLIEMVTFVFTVLVAYAYVWRRGGLEWD